MLRAFDLVQQCTDVVEGDARLEGAEIASVYSEGCAAGCRRPAGEAASQRVVHDAPEGLAGSPRELFQLRCHILVKGQCRSHTLMLCTQHHDVRNARGHAFPRRGLSRRAGERSAAQSGGYGT